MKKIGIVVIVLLIFDIFIFFNNKEEKVINENKYLKLNGMIIDNNKEKNNIKIQDDKNAIYKINFSTDLENGSNVKLEYEGQLNKNKEVQDIIVKDIKKIKVDYLNDDGIFSECYKNAYNIVKGMTRKEKIGQLLLVRYPDSNQVEILKNYNFGGYLFFAKDLKDKSTSEVQEMINNLQNNSKIPILTAVDEEGGKVVRISSNLNLVNEKFKSPRELYLEGGFDLIKEDTIKKSKILNNLGFNLNLAPVVDISTNENDYIYNRTLGEGVTKTSTYAKTVISASKDSKVTYTLKHFPGYGGNVNTHTGTAIDNRSYEDIMNNSILPFEYGIKAGAEAVLISHNIIKNIDASNPASLSVDIHNILRNKLNFSGIIITDSLDMKSVSDLEDVYTKAVIAGNDMLITTDFEKTINDINTAIENNTISEKLIDRIAQRIIAWKLFKGLEIKK